MVEVEDFLGESKQREKRHFCKHSDHIETKHNHPGQPEESIFTLHFYVYSELLLFFFFLRICSVCLRNYLECGILEPESGILIFRA